MINIILCGGSGTRLWPISRKLMPKQFVKLFNNKSLFQLTIERNSKICDRQFIVSNMEQYFLAIDQLEELNKTHNQYLLEPIPRNTAPAIALACFALNKDDLVLVTPSDHLIKNEKEYEKVLKKAKELALKDNLVTFGIKPTFPETGFGYIEAEGNDVKKFHEKPNLETAKKYLELGNYYWNSGMFCFKAGVFLEELKKYAPKIYETSKIAFENRRLINESQIRIKEEFMSEIPEDSVDYAVMEKSKRVKVVPSDIDWNDVGSFDALAKECKTSNIKTYEEDSNNNFYYSNNKKQIIATIGLENFIVVDTKDALLIVKKGESQKVKKIVNKLKINNRDLLTTPPIVHRPWGSFETLIEEKGYKIKRIIVKPGKRLSLQKHYHRSEHWVVLSGTATIQVGDEVKLLRPNESTYIKIGEIHRLSNEGKIPVVIIEAQVGEYTGEDDIVRIEDDFKRDLK